jgi:hypothetical protein
MSDKKQLLRFAGCVISRMLITLQTTVHNARSSHAENTLSLFEIIGRFLPELCCLVVQENIHGFTRKDTEIGDYTVKKPPCGVSY